MRALFSIFTLIFTFSTFAFEVSRRERSLYERFASSIHQSAAYCLQETWDTHIEFYKKWKVSKYYGDRNPSLNTVEKRKAALQRAGAPASLEPQLEGISCIGLARKCLGLAMGQTDNSELQSLWSRLDAYVRANGVSGVYLVNALQKLGWKILYWNPKPSENAQWDAEDVQNLPGYPVNWDSGVKNEKGEFIYNPGWECTK